MSEAAVELDNTRAGTQPLRVAYSIPSPDPRSDCLLLISVHHGYTRAGCNCGMSIEGSDAASVMTQAFDHLEDK